MKEIASTINVKSFMSTFFTMEAPTPEEQEYLELCRRVREPCLLRTLIEIFICTELAVQSSWEDQAVRILRVTQCTSERFCPGTSTYLASVDH